jgi:hypothetical protein
MTATIEIARVDDRRGVSLFVDLPFRLYRSDPNWVPPLRAAQTKLFGRKTAFFEHADMQLFLAQRDGKPVARIAAIHNRAHADRYADGVGFFGFFECAERDAEAAQSLVRSAGAWLATRGLCRIRGPVNPSMNAECGLLIDGFDRPPSALMPYNPPWYAEALGAAGFEKCKDLLAYWVDGAKLLPGTPAYERLVRIRDLLRRRHPEIHVTPIDMRRYQGDIIRFSHIFEEARRNNWGYVPMTSGEIVEMAREMRMIVDPAIVLFADVGGEPAGVSLGIPNVNIPLSRMNGRLFPFGFLRLLWEVRRLSEIRIFGIAALEKYRPLGIAALLLVETIIRGTAKGYTGCEASWVLEDNMMSNRTIQSALEPRHYKTYRIYEKAIG